MRAAGGVGRQSHAAAAHTGTSTPALLPTHRNSWHPMLHCGLASLVPCRCGQVQCSCRCRAARQCVAPRAATRPDAQPASTTPSDAASSEWSANLLKLTRRKRRKSSSRSRDLRDAVELDFTSADAAAAGGFMVEDEDGDDDSNVTEGSRMLVEKKRLPAIVRCFDTASIYIKSGDGGAGCVSFRREPYVEKGGPNGGNGGRGGHVWAIADEGANSLLSFRNQLHFRATPGSAGACAYVRICVGRCCC